MVEAIIQFVSSIGLDLGIVLSSLTHGIQIFSLESLVHALKGITKEKKAWQKAKSPALLLIERLEEKYEDQPEIKESLEQFKNKWSKLRINLKEIYKAEPEERREILKNKILEKVDKFESLQPIRDELFDKLESTFRDIFIELAKGSPDFFQKKTIEALDELEKAQRLSSAEVKADLETLLLLCRKFELNEDFVKKRLKEIDRKLRAIDELLNYYIDITNDSEDSVLNSFMRRPIFGKKGFIIDRYIEKWADECITHSQKTVVFVVGDTGSGKSSFLFYMWKKLKANEKKIGLIKRTNKLSDSHINKDFFLIYDDLNAEMDDLLIKSLRSNMRIIITCRNFEFEKIKNLYGSEQFKDFVIVNLDEYKERRENFYKDLLIDQLERAGCNWNNNRVLNTIINKSCNLAVYLKEVADYFKLKGYKEIDDKKAKELPYGVLELFVIIFYDNFIRVNNHASLATLIAISQLKTMNIEKNHFYELVEVLNSEYCGDGIKAIDYLFESDKMSSYKVGYTFWRDIFSPEYLKKEFKNSYNREIKIYVRIIEKITAKNDLIKSVSASFKMCSEKLIEKAKKLNNTEYYENYIKAIICHINNFPIDWSLDLQLSDFIAFIIKKREQLFIPLYELSDTIRYNCELTSSKCFQFIKQKEYGKAIDLLGKLVYMCYISDNILRVNSSIFGRFAFVDYNSFTFSQTFLDLFCPHIKKYKKLLPTYIEIMILYAAMVKLDTEDYKRYRAGSIAIDAHKYVLCSSIDIALQHIDGVCPSAKIVLDYMSDGNKEKIKEINNIKDYVFKDVLKRLYKFNKTN